jgi:hypothetical protein
MTKVAPLAVRAKIIILEFLTCLDFGLVMGVGTAVSLLALAMYKLFANSICG